jgi:hypothetical protein
VGDQDKLAHGYSQLVMGQDQLVASQDHLAACQNKLLTCQELKWDEYRPKTTRTQNKYHQGWAEKIQ